MYERDAGTFSHLLVRPPADYALLTILSHEVAHLALYFGGEQERESTTVIECAADIVAAALASALAPRISTAGEFDLQHSDIPTVFANSIFPGYWVAKDQHPDGEQRRACLGAGFSLYGQLNESQRFAGNTILTSKRDSLVDDLLLNRVNLLDAAVQQSRDILSVLRSNQLRDAAPDTGLLRLNALMLSPAYRSIVSLYDSLLAKLQLPGGLNVIRGPLISTGVALFPSAEVHELLLPVGAPWKCAILPPANGRAESVACYAITTASQALDNYLLHNEIMGLLRRRGFRSLAIGPATSRGAQVDIEQWLIERDSTRMVISFYTEPYLEGEAFALFSRRTIKWFSLTPIPTSQPLRSSP